MLEQAKTTATDWILSIVKEHNHEPSDYVWSGSPEKPTLLLMQRNNTITFSQAIFSDCANDDNAARASVKESLITIMHDIKTRDYRNRSFIFTAQNSYTML